MAPGAASKSVSGDGHTSALANQIFIFEHGEWDVGDGAHRLNVMNRWETLVRKIRPPTEQSEVKRYRRCRRATSRKAEVAPPSYFDPCYKTDPRYTSPLSGLPAVTNICPRVMSNAYNVPES